MRVSERPKSWTSLTRSPCLNTSWGSGKTGVFSLASVDPWPKRAGDILDASLQNQVATIESIQQDYEGRAHLAVVLDAFSRRIVGWAMGHDLKAQLVLDALNMALTQRRPIAVIHHSDQGSQYTSIAFGHRCREAGIRPSMGSVGDCFDNAMCESFFATLECELLDRTSFRTPAEGRQAIFQFIEGWYNPHRRHSGIDYLSPNRYEAQHARTP